MPFKELPKTFSTKMEVKEGRKSRASNATSYNQVPAEVIGIMHARITAHSRSFGGCTYTSYKGTKSTTTTAVGAPRIAVYFNGKHYNLLCKVVMMLSGNNSPINNKAVQASHLCGNGMCVNPDHLVWESAAANISRSACQEHVQDADYECGHSPKCLPTPEKPPQGFFDLIPKPSFSTTRRLARKPLKRLADE